MAPPETVQATFAATVVDEWVRAGLAAAVISPGSRSTPLALALVADGRVDVRVVLDERVAAFTALGVGLATGWPAVVLTTSGTAAVEVHPAVVEAHHARVPLLVCTGDRPPDLQAVGAPQTIDQSALFGPALRWRVDADAGALAPTAWRSVAARAYLQTLADPLGPGPVHVNLPFRDPLVGTPGEVPEGRRDGRPWHAVSRRASVAVPAATEAASLVDGRAGVIVAGAGITAPTAVLEVSRALHWPVLADARSRCRGQWDEGTVVVSAFDSLLRSEEFAGGHRPEVILRVGAPPTSKVLAEWIKASGCDEVVADPWGAWHDPDRRASVIVAASPEALCEALVSAGPVPGPDGWAASWRRAEWAAQSALDAALVEVGLSEPSVARAVTLAFGEAATIVVSSSMPIRDIEWFGSPVCSARVLANRGANGIDGVVSTALGVAASAAAREPVVAVVGDLAFLHDIGALAGAARFGGQLLVVVVDNDGGGIFSFLPQADIVEPARFEQLFGTPHGLDLAAVAASFGLPVVTVPTLDALAPAMLGAVEGGGVQVVHVRTDRLANVAAHRKLADAVEAAVNSL